MRCVKSYFTVFFLLLCNQGHQTALTPHLNQLNLIRERVQVGLAQAYQAALTPHLKQLNLIRE